MITAKVLQLDDDLFIREAEKYLVTNLKNSITVDEIAEQVSVSKRKLQQRFKEHYGKSVQDYLSQKRMEKAAMLLEETKYSIKVIARECGYGRINSFIRAFTKAHKISPAQWRKRESLN
jgi:AraC-like DNA-binding protein